jgi:glycosyltransferase involved in cell wall biosynthesis
MALMRRSERVRALLLNPLQPFPGYLPAPLLASPLLRWNTATEIDNIGAMAPLAFHLMSPFELSDPATAVVPPHLMRPDIPLIVTLYDLIPYLMPERYLVDPAWKKRYMQRVEVIRGADLVLAISEATRQDAIRELGMSPARVVNIQGGVGPEFTSPTDGTQTFGSLRERLPAIRSSYFFTVAGAEYRKNTERLIEAYAALPRALRSRHQLVITCELPRGWRDAWLERARQAGCADGEVLLTGRVDDSTLVQLYQSAKLFVFPSLYEGFGLPVAESIACSRPAITSNVSSLPEILEYPSATFDPESISAISALMARGVDDDDFHQELTEVARRRAPLFRWDAVAERSLEAVATVVDRDPERPGRARIHPRRLKVALVTPLPPEQSGIASYSARIIPKLAERVDLEVLYASRQERPTVSWRGVPLLPINALGRYLNPHAYHAIIYAVGNSPSHLATYEMMTTYPGIGWFHDVRLPHLYWHYAQSVGVNPHTFIGEQLRRHYGSRAPGHAVEEWSLDLVDRFGLGLTPELVRGSRHVIVHSPFAERLLRLDQGPDVRCPPITVLPLAAAPLRHGGPVPRRQPPVVGSLGLVDERKLPLLLIDAIAEIPLDHRPRLVFIGPCEDWKRDWLLGHAHRRGLADGVDFTGWISVEDWQTQIAGLTCAVQLRAGSNGESAASIRDAMASGVPVITNMMAIAEEFPSDSIDALPTDTGASVLAQHICAVCNDAATWRSLSRGAWRYSNSVTEAQVADQLVEIIRATVDAEGTVGMG